MKKILLSCIFFTMMMADGFTPFAGLAMNGGNDLKSESPLGVFGARYDEKYYSVYYRHISSIPQVDETQGINEVGANLKYKYKALEPYCGITYTNKKLTSEYYTKQIGHNSLISGIKIPFKDKEIYVEYRIAKTNVLMYGFNITFSVEDLVD